MSIDRHTNVQLRTGAISTIGAQDSDVNKASTLRSLEAL